MTITSPCTSRCRALVVCETGLLSRCTQRVKRWLGERQKVHSTHTAECTFQQGPRTEERCSVCRDKSHTACAALADDHVELMLSTCRSSWQQQRLWVKRLCWLRSAVCHPAHAEAPGGHGRKRFVRFNYHVPYTRTTSQKRRNRSHHPPIYVPRNSHPNLSNVGQKRDQTESTRDTEIPQS